MGHRLFLGRWREALRTRFLPLWAKRSLLAENEALRQQAVRLREENRLLRAYIQGLRTGLRPTPGRPRADPRGSGIPKKETKG